jgi:hypothetical protein
MVQPKVKVTLRQSISMSWCLVHWALKGFHPNEFESDIRRCTLRRNFSCYHWKDCIVEFGYQLSICSGTKKNHGKLCSSWPAIGPSGCKLTSSRSRSGSYFTTDSQSVSMSWHLVPLWGLRPDIISCRNVAV